MEHKFIGKTYANKGTEVAFCHLCGFIHQTVLPSPDSAESYYGEKDAFYQTFSPPNWFVREKKEHDRGLWNPYYDYKIGLLKRGKAYISIFDVGCGAGWFVRRANQHPNVVGAGYEPSASALGFLNLPYVGQDRWLASLFTILPDDIHMSLVLEHILDPRGELLYWVKQMKQGARLMVIVPNEFNPLQKRLKTPHFISPVHINYFDGETLRNLMQSVGLRVIHESATAPMELFILAGLNYLDNDTLGHKCHMARLYFERTFGVRAFNLYHKLYQRWGIGRELVFMGQKI